MTREAIAVRDAMYGLPLTRVAAALSMMGLVEMERAGANFDAAQRETEANR